MTTKAKSLFRIFPKTRAHAVFVMLVCFLFFLCLAQASAQMLKDVPAGHWAREAAKKLVEEGWMTESDKGLFRGQAPLTRYELALSFSHVLERLDNIEELVSSGETSGVDAETKEAIRKLTKELSPELKTLGKKIAGVNKKLAALPEPKKLAKELRKISLKQRSKLTKLKRDVSQVQQQIDALKKDVRRVEFHGFGEVVFDNRDYSESNIGDNTLFTIDQYFLANKPSSATLFSPKGKAPPAFFESFDTLLLDFKASPPISIKTNKVLEMHARLFSERRLGSPTSDPALTIGDSTWRTYPATGFIQLPEEVSFFSFPSSTAEFSRPTLGFAKKDVEDLDVDDLYFLLKEPPDPKRKSMLTLIRGGSTSAAWSPFSLNLGGFPFQGIKATGKIRSFKVEGILSRIRKASEISFFSPDPNNEEGNVETKVKVFEEILYGASVERTFKKEGKVKISYLKDRKNRDSQVIDEADKDKYKPFQTQILSGYFVYPLFSSLTFSGELAYNRFARFSSAPLIKDAAGNIKLTEPPQEKSSSFAAFFSLDWENPKYGLSGTFFTQPEDFFNLYGGVYRLISPFSDGGLTLWGLNLNVLERGGGLKGFMARGRISFPVNYGLELSGSAVSTAEATPLPLYEIEKRLLVDLPFGGTEGEDDTDISSRGTMNFISFSPKIRYRPSKKTELTFGFNIKKFTFPRASGTGTAGEVARLSIQEVDGTNIVNPCNNVNTINKFVEWTDNSSKHFVGEVALGAASYDFTLYEETNGACAINTPKQNIANTSTVTLPIDLNQNDVGGISSNPANGNYMLNNDSTQLRRQTTKNFAWELRRFRPYFNVTHTFSDKLRAEFEWWEEQIRVPVGDYFSTGDLQTETEKNALQVDKKRAFSLLVHYEIIKNLDVEFFWEVLKFHIFPSIDSHSEKRVLSQLTMKLVF